MIVRLDRASHRLALAAALMAALGLAACGRKGALDAPPGANDPALRAAPAPASLTPQQQQEQSLLGNMTGRDGTAPVAPKGANKRIPLDVLLD